MRTKKDEIRKSVKLEVLCAGEDEKIVGFSLLAKETAGQDILQFCHALAGQINANKLKLTVIEEKLLLCLYEPLSPATTTAKFLLANQKEANILGRIINNDPEIEDANNRKIEAIKGKAPDHHCCGVLVIGVPKRKL